MKKFDVMICKNDKYELPVYICDTIEEASKWLGCSRSALYKSFHLNGVMTYKQYKVEIVKR